MDSMRLKQDDPSSQHWQSLFKKLGSGEYGVLDYETPEASANLMIRVEDSFHVSNRQNRAFYLHEADEVGFAFR